MRLAVKLAYDGTRFHGSQSQPDVRTVHQAVAEALRKLGHPEPRLAFAGRTDAGVSAVGNVVAFETALPPATLLPALTFQMEDAWAWAAAEVDADFEPRHAAWRRYRYLLRTSLDVAPVAEAFALFEGAHDFTGFCRLEPHVDPHRVVLATDVSREGPYLVLDVVGRSFLWNQVRRMVEAARRVAAGELAPDEVRRVLDAGAPADLGTAPPEPLLLVEVAYEGVRFVPHEDLGRLALRLEGRLARVEDDAARLRAILGGVS